MFRLICMLIGYGIGCVESAHIIGKLWHVDLRQRGSGNLGTTNALRVLGKKAGALVFIGDILKSVTAFLICRAVFKGADVTTGGLLAGMYGSVGAVLGHNYPFYLKFKGGKGIATMIGMTACLAFGLHPMLAVPTALLGFGLAFGTRYVSIGSLAFALVLPITCYLLHYPTEIIWVTVGVSALAFWRHRLNIKKLLNGTENKFGSKKE